MKAKRAASRARMIAAQLLALVHQGFTAQGAVHALHVDELAANIARTLMQSRDQQAQRVSFHFAPVRTDADRAAPLSFLIGEAISAALDQIEDEEGEIRLYLHQDEGGEVRFAVDMDGAADATASPQSVRLIDAFARQLGAQMGRDPSRPSRIWVVLPPAAA